MLYSSTDISSLEASFVFVFRKIHNQKNPTIPATNEASSIAIFDCVIINSSLNARRVMKIDMVNPIPASIPIPNICFHFTSLGIEQMPIETAKKLNKNIPSGLPIKSPIKIPILFISSRPSYQLLSIIIHFYFTDYHIIFSD